MAIRPRTASDNAVTGLECSFLKATQINGSAG